MKTAHKFFASEGELQRWVVKKMVEQGWHAQPLTEDPKYPGIPDITASHQSRVGDFWLELKCDRQEQYVWSNLKLKRRLTRQQHGWLTQRATHSSTPGPRCGVLVAWRFDLTEYVTWVPVNEWDYLRFENMAVWALLPQTASTGDLESGKVSFITLLSSDGQYQGKK